MALYDALGRTYTTTRRPDPRVAAAIGSALGGARTVLNVGAGTGSYEPADRQVLAVEPSWTMIAQRAPGAAPVVQATAEALPLYDGAVDACLTVFSDHHWLDRTAGLRELRRVARDRVVLVNADPARIGDFWFVAEYLPSFLEGLTFQPWREELTAALGPVELSRCPSRTTAWTASSAPTGVGRRRTSIRWFEPGSRCSRGWRRPRLPRPSQR